MTIAVAIRTKSAVVFAADSKLTLNGHCWLEANGSLHWGGADVRQRDEGRS